MDSFRLLEFQINQLGYQFKNIDLLQEALTHSLDGQDANPHFKNQNRQFGRLQILGNAVVKFTISRYVVQTSEVTAREGVLTQRKDRLIHGGIQKKVGVKLFQPYSNPIKNLFKLLRAGQSFLANRSLEEIIPYEKFVRAIMGAVYLDAGGVSGDGLEATFNLFLKIWEEHLDKKGCEFGENVQTSFPSPSSGILEYWARKDLGKGFIEKVERSIGVKFKKGHLLAEALIQATFYDGFTFQQQGPHYERLEFLGDSVLGLIVTELLWMEYPFDTYCPTPLDHKITALISESGQKKIFEKLGLAKFVKMKVGGIPGWSKQDDIVESVVGAVFVDGGGVAAKEFIIKTWELKVNSREPNLDDLQDKLGYKFQNENFLLQALSHPQGTLKGPNQLEEEDSPGRRDVLKYFGKSWIHFHATEYSLRSSAPHDSVAALVYRRNNLCGENILLRIGSNLNLSKYGGLSRDQLNRGMEPYMLYEDIIQAIVGAIFKDMQAAKIKMKFSNIFYRLWNPFLQKCPNGDLDKNFPSGIVGGAMNGLREWEVTEIEGNVLYNFTRQYLLEEVIKPVPVGTIRNNPGKLSFLGEALLDLVVSVYVAILCYQIDEVGLAEVDFFHARTLSECMDRAENLYEVETLWEHGGCTPGARVSDSELIKRLFGAVYVDMSGINADMTFSEWKNYFIVRCEFISDKPREQ